MSRRRCSSFFGALGFALTLAAAAAAQPTGGQACAEPPPCGSKCSNLPYLETNCWTTEYGPAKADIVVVDGKGTPTDSPNMLECPSGPYALCFASGPAVKTGSNPNNKVLPCLMDPLGKTALCSCLYFTSGTSYVDINAILNLNAWYETVAGLWQARRALPEHQEFEVLRRIHDRRLQGRSGLPIRARAESPR